LNVRAKAQPTKTLRFIEDNKLMSDLFLFQERELIEATAE